MPINANLNRMKKIITSLAVASLFFMSCTKDADVLTPPSATYEVKFGVSALSSNTYEKASKEVEAPDKVLDSYTIYIYDSNGALKDSIRKTKSDSNYGQASIRLQEGVYNAVVVGNNTIKAPASSFDAAVIEESFSKETFSAIQPFKVVANGTKDVAITLRRTIGRVELNLTDEFKETYKTLKVTYSNAPVSYSLAHSATLATKDFEISEKLVNDNPVDAAFYSFGNEANAAGKTIVIEAYDTSDNLIVSRSIGNVTILPNHITKITGKIFDGNADFVITVDTAWDDDINIPIE